MRMGNKGLARAGAAVLGAVAGWSVARAYRDIDPHPVRTASGPALVRTVRGLGGGAKGAPGEPVRVLQKGGVFQSATYLGARRFEPPFAYYRAFDAMFEAEDAMRAGAGHGISHVLMLGGGGFSCPKHLLTTHEGISMDVVEVDPAMVGIARRWFFLGELESRLSDPATSHGNALKVIVGDGRAYLDAACDGAPGYDAIVNDAFCGARPARPLATVEAARAARSALRPGGVYLVNVVSEDGGCDVSFLRDEVATLLQVFSEVAIVEACDEAFGGEDNYLLIASDAPYRFAGEIPYDADFPMGVIRDGG